MRDVSLKYAPISTTPPPAVTKQPSATITNLVRVRVGVRMRVRARVEG
jgi:hypothetical protein